MAASAIASPAVAQTQLAGNPQTGQANEFAQNRYEAQSFTVAGPMGSTFNNIAFNFFNTAGANVATGNLYLFAADCSATCSPNNLAATPGSLGNAAAAGGQYTFASTVTLTAGQTYYVYTDTAQTIAIDGFDAYAGGNQFLGAPGNNGNGNYTSVPGRDTTFNVTGDLVNNAPEPATWTLLIGGFGAVGGTLRRRRAGGQRLHTA